MRCDRPSRGSGPCLAAAGADSPSTSAPTSGTAPLFASELEFYLYKQSYAQAHDRDFRDLTPTQTVAKQCGTSAEMLERSYSFAIEDLEDEGPKAAEEERRRARQLALSAAERRQLRVA